MRVVIATFEVPACADAFTEALREDFGGAAHVSRNARIGAQGEPHDGHRLVVAWVPSHVVEHVRGRASSHGGVLHEPPALVAPPDGVTPAQPPARLTLGELAAKLAP